MTTAKPTPLDALAPNHCLCDWPECVCRPAEKALRFIKAGNASFTQKQREWCFNEIASVTGYWPEEYINASDMDVARAVLEAWLDYSRDTGLL
jgi:hypothetical protein